jgi:hypothetical protein
MSSTVAVESKQEWIDLIVEYAASPAEATDLKTKLPRYTLQELRNFLQQLRDDDERQKRIKQDARSIAQAELAPEREALIEQQQQNQLEELWLSVLRTPINGKFVRNVEANKGPVFGWASGPHEVISGTWFADLMKQYPNLAAELIWEVALTPAQREQQKRAQEQADRGTFLQVCKEIGMSACEGNWSLISSSTLGPGFTAAQLRNVVQSGAVRVVGATEVEAAAWRQEAIDTRNKFLQNADVGTLRTLANQEAQQTRVATAQAQAQADYQARVERDSHMGYKPMPEIWRGEKLDQAFLLSRKKCPAETMRKLIDLFGAAAVESRIRGN